MESFPALIELSHVSVMRGGKIALDDVTLRIGVGEHVAVLGPNGSGKSTLIETITCECYPLPRPDSSIMIFGNSQWNVFDLRVLLGVVSNDLMSQCSRKITGQDVVLSGFFSGIGLWPHQRITPAMRNRTAEVLAFLDISHLAGRFVSEMSSGEARRVLIARALVHNPRALLLDEPGNSLDLFAQRELRGVVRRLAQSGIGIVLVTHQVADIIPEIDRIILMRQGRIVGDGPKGEMLTVERLSALFEVPVALAKRDGYFHTW
ncbi:MAG: ATP-binding cassette domain-containing protein [Acidobacteria bacterium]|nr:ATP-binding cassette domain-containing protein [Acidobacteriota bacterium]